MRNEPAQEVAPTKPGRHTSTAVNDTVAEVPTPESLARLACQRAFDSAKASGEIGGRDLFLGRTAGSFVLIDEIEMAGRVLEVMDQPPAPDSILADLLPRHGKASDLNESQLCHWPGLKRSQRRMLPLGPILEALLLYPKPEASVQLARRMRDRATAECFLWDAAGDLVDAGRTVEALRVLRHAGGDCGVKLARLRVRRKEAEGIVQEVEKTEPEYFRSELAAHLALRLLRLRELEAAHQLAELVRPSEEAIHLRLRMATHLRRRPDKAAATRHLDYAEALIGRLWDSTVESKTSMLCELAVSCYRLGYRDRATALIEEAKRSSEDIRGPAGPPAGWIEVAGALRRTGARRAAVEWCHRALGRLAEIDDPDTRRRLLLRVFDLKIFPAGTVGRRQQLSLLEQAADAARSCTDRSWRLMGLLEVSRCYSRLHECELACQTLDLSAEGWTEGGQDTPGDGPWHMIVDELIDLGALDRAEQVLLLVKTDPLYTAFLARVASAHLGRGNWQQANAAADRMSDGYERAGVFLKVFLAIMEQSQAQPDPSLASVAFKNCGPGAWSALAKEAVKQGILERLMEWLRSYCQSIPARDEAYAQVAEGLASIPRKDLAIDMVLAIENEEPRSKALSKVAWSLSLAGQPEAALEVLEGMVFGFDRWMATIKIAEDLIEAGRVQQGLAVIQTVLHSAQHPVDGMPTGELPGDPSAPTNARHIIRRFEGSMMYLIGLGKVAFLLAPLQPENALELAQAVREGGVMSRAQFDQVVRRIVLSLAMNATRGGHWRLRSHFARKDLPLVRTIADMLQDTGR